MTMRGARRTHRSSSRDEVRRAQLADRIAREPPESRAPTIQDEGIASVGTGLIAASRKARRQQLCDLACTARPPAADRPCVIAASHAVFARQRSRGSIIVSIVARSRGVHAQRARSRHARHRVHADDGRDEKLRPVECVQEHLSRDHLKFPCAEHRGEVRSHFETDQQLWHFPPAGSRADSTR